MPKAMFTRLISIIAGVIGFLLLLGFISLFFIDQQLQVYIESELNQQLSGYSVELEREDFHPLGFSIDFEHLFLRQKAIPDPPLLNVPMWTASVQWRELLKLRIVSDHILEHANLVLRQAQAEEEVKDQEALEDRGWQQALFALYPVKVNTIRIEDGSFSYHGEGSHPPLELTNLRGSVENIRNVPSSEGEYPSTIHLKGTLHPSGQLNVAGHANFLSEPFPGISLDVDISHLELTPFIPVSSLVHVDIQSGILNGHGHVEYAPWTQQIQINSLALKDPHVDYIAKRESTPPKTKQAETPTPKGVQEQSQVEGVQVVVEHATIKNGELGYVNQTMKPPYRIFFNKLDLELTGIGVPKITQQGQLTLKGRFMGEGDTLIEGSFKPEDETPDFDIKVKIGETKMTTLNKVFLAHGNFDVKQGLFSLYTELKARDGQVKGYIKPFFENPEVYDLAQDTSDNIFQQMYEGVLGGISSLLENVPRDQVATKTDISGELKEMKVNTWELIINLLKNAFVDALAPSFDQVKEAGAP